MLLCGRLCACAGELQPRRRICDVTQHPTRSFASAWCLTFLKPLACGLTSTPQLNET